MFKNQNKKALHAKPQQSHHTSPLTTTKRTKTWKRRMERQKQGLPKGLQTTKPGHLTQVLHDRKLVREHLTSYSQISPQSEWRMTPSKLNGWTVEAVDPIPQDLQRRVMSFADQFDTPIRPKQIINHFVNHPTAPTKKHHVYTTMTQLVTANNMRKYTKVDEEGNIHWFIGTTTMSRVKHNGALERMIKNKRPLPLEEVVWESLGDDSMSFANLRTMAEEDKAAFFAMKKAKDAAALNKI